MNIKTKFHRLSGDTGLAFLKNVNIADERDESVLVCILHVFGRGVCVMADVVVFNVYNYNRNLYCTSDTQNQPDQSSQF